MPPLGIVAQSLVLSVNEKNVRQTTYTTLHRKNVGMLEQPEQWRMLRTAVAVAKMFVSRFSRGHERWPGNVLCT